MLFFSVAVQAATKASASSSTLALGGSFSVRRGVFPASTLSLPLYSGRA